jgi:hypothetical protein
VTLLAYAREGHELTWRPHVQDAARQWWVCVRMSD